MKRDTDGPYTIWFVDTFENRTRLRTFETLESAVKRSQRIINKQYAEMAYGTGVHITDGRGETISAELVQ